MSVLDTLTGTAAQHPVPPSSPAAARTVTIVPYNARVDAQASDFLPWMWKRMQKDDLVDYYFPGQSATGYADFVRLFSGDGNVALVVLPDSSHQWEKTIAGFVTWVPSRMGAADVIIAGCVFFREFWDHVTTDATAVESFKFWFTEARAQVVLGVCPALHVAIARFNKRVGFREIGRIPQAHLYKGEVCDAVLWAITRQEWEMRGHTE
jgi:RimJ/RimL family protein N-acetyltransferase